MKSVVGVRRRKIKIPRSGAPAVLASARSGADALSPKRIVVPELRPGCRSCAAAIS